MNQFFTDYFSIPLAILVLAITIFLLIKRFETRMILFGSGLLLCTLALEPMSAFDKFSSAMTSAGLIQAICSSVGFAFVMNYTKCNQSLVQVLSKPLSKLTYLLIPLTICITFLVNSAIPSAAGCAATVGTTLIPLLIGARIHPAIAAGAVACGTFGSFLSPGDMHNVFISNLTNGKTNEITLVTNNLPYLMISIIIVSSLLFLTGFLRKELKTTQNQATNSKNSNEPLSPMSKKTYFLATAPFIPLILLLASNLNLIPIKLNVPSAMVIGTMYAMIITRFNPGNISEEFFNGMGNAYAGIIGIVIGASVFVQGLQSIGFVDLFIKFLTEKPHYARFGGTLGPFFMGIITGSGDAISLAFNQSVTPFAQSFGLITEKLGSATAFSGAIGRAVSPISGVVVVCAGIAKVNPFEISKRVALPMFSVVLFLALFML